MRSEPLPFPSPLFSVRMDGTAQEEGQDGEVLEEFDDEVLEVDGHVVGGNTEEGEGEGQGEGEEEEEEEEEGAGEGEEDAAAPAASEPLNFENAEDFGASAVQLWAEVRAGECDPSADFRVQEDVFKDTMCSCRIVLYLGLFHCRKIVQCEPEVVVRCSSCQRFLPFHLESQEVQ